MVKETGLPRAQIEFMYEVFIDTVADALKDGKDVILSRLGQFRFREETRTGRISNLTGQMILPRPTLRFKINSTLKSEVNKELIKNVK